MKRPTCKDVMREYLRTHFAAHPHTPVPALSTLAVRLGFSAERIHSARQALAKEGFLFRVGNDRNARYYLVPTRSPYVD